MKLAPLFALLFLLPFVQGSEIPALPKGTAALGSSCMAVPDKFEEPMIDYLKGTSLDGAYIGGLLLKGPGTLVTEVKVPDNKAAFGDFAGKKIPLALYVLYPSSANNHRADYRFPYKDTGDNSFPHMQGTGDKPLFAEAGKKYPVIFYSTGYDAHGLWDLEHLKSLASHGYIVVSIFHGDARFGFFNCFNIRPLLFRKAMDYLLAHPDYAPVIDTERIGAAGSSFGGYTILVASGANYSRTLPAEADPRIKCAFGLVPYMGSSWKWPFGKDFSGLSSVKIPFMAVYALDDENVPPFTVEGGLKKLGGEVTGVSLAGEKHLLSKEVWSDVFTWETLFFDAHLKGDAKARALLLQADSVSGGVKDRKTQQR